MPLRVPVYLPAPPLLKCPQSKSAPNCCSPSLPHSKADRKRSRSSDCAPRHTITAPPRSPSGPWPLPFAPARRSTALSGRPSRAIADAAAPLQTGFAPAPLPPSRHPPAFAPVPPRAQAPRGSRTLSLPPRTLGAPPPHPSSLSSNRPASSPAPCSGNWLAPAGTVVYSHPRPPSGPGLPAPPVTALGAHDRLARPESAPPEH